ncbi:MAG TPA: hypothetical protein VJT54_06720 [Verrucomicrobiae bacterium]|nr:hypothetical protein [Verrucomicrobiae bacterium]
MSDARKIKMSAGFNAFKISIGLFTSCPMRRHWHNNGNYFSDPEGYHWEVVWAPNVTFDKHGHIVL